MANEVLYLLEDDSSIAELVTLALQLNGISVKAFCTCQAFKEAITTEPPDIVVLDIMLPDGSGLDVLSFIRQSYHLPVIMLSALGRENDKVKALNMGADDYIAKPFGVLEFAARVKANIRKKADFSQKLEIISCGEITLNSSTMEAHISGSMVQLSAMEFALLKYFMANKNIALSRENLLENVWGYDVGQTRTIDNHVARLRKLVGNSKIETVFNHGYKFKA